MVNDVRASNARTSGNYGLWETLRRDRDAESHDTDDEDAAPQQWLHWSGRAIRWSLAGGAFLAYVNHWPGGH